MVREISLRRLKVRTWLHRILVVFAWVCVLTFFAWGIGALYFLQSVPPLLRVLLAVGYFAGAIGLAKYMQSRSRWLAVIAMSIGVVYLLTLTQRPSNDRDWVQEQSRTPRIQFDGDRVRVSNVRNSVYRTETDFDVVYEEQSFRVSELTSVWFIVQKFSPLQGLAHTFLSFERATEDGPKYLGVSIEVRREKGEVYSPLRGLYRLYEVIYVLGDERDLIGSRTVLRPNDRVWMYRVNATPDEVQMLFADVAGQVNELNKEPLFYHTLLRNCTNEIVTHTYELTPEPINWLDPRIVLPGFSGRFAYSQGLVGESGQTWQQLQDQARIDQRARDIGITPDFSVRLRDGR
jgi:hypothetical protein